MKGGYRTWALCDGSLKPAKKIVTAQSGICSGCGKIKFVYRDGKVARHKEA